MFIFFFFFASALSALHLYNEPKFVVIGNPVILEQSHAHNALDLWDRGTYIQQQLVENGVRKKKITKPNRPLQAIVIFQEILS